MGLIDFLFGAKKVSDVPFWALNSKMGNTKYGWIDFLYGGKKVSDVPFWVLEEKMKDYSRSRKG